MYFLQRPVLQSIAIALALAVDISRANTNITDELGPLLSSGAEIVYPGSTEFLAAIDRDNRQDPPTYAVVVDVATESDVQETVSNCTEICQKKKNQDRTINETYQQTVKIN